MQVKVMDNHRVISLILVLLIMILVSGLTATMVLYQTAFENTRHNLIDTARMQSSMLEAMYQFKERSEPIDFINQDKDILEQYIKAIEHYKQANEAVEVEIAVRQNNLIVFLLRHQSSKTGQPGSLAFDSKLAEPMVQALSGQSGSIVSLDYKGKEVVAAYQYIDSLDLGVVAKMDVEKIQQPFLRATYYVLLLSALLVFIGVYLFIKIGSPIVDEMRNNEKLFRSLFNESTYFVGLLSLYVVQMLNDTARKTFKWNQKAMKTNSSIHCHFGII